MIQNLNLIQGSKYSCRNIGHFREKYRMQHKCLKKKCMQHFTRNVFSKPSFSFNFKNSLSKSKAMILSSENIMKYS